MGHTWKSLLLRSQSCSEIEDLIAKLCPLKITVAPTQGFFYQIDTLDYNLSNSGASLLGYQYQGVLAMGYQASKTCLLVNIDYDHKQWIDPHRIFPTPVAREISSRTKGRALLLQNRTPVVGTQLALLDKHQAIFGRVWLTESNDFEDCNLFIFGKRGYNKQLKRFLRMLRNSLNRSKIEYSQFELSLSNNLPNLSATNYDDVIHPQQPITIAISKLLIQALNQVKANIKWIGPHPDPEFLHDLRSSMRKAQATLNYFESSIALIGVETFRTELAYFLKQTSKPRNFEVLQMKLEEMTDKVTKQPNYPLILKHCREETESQYQHLIEELGSARFEVFLAEWSRLASRASSIALKLRYSSETGISNLPTSLMRNSGLEPPSAEQTFAEAVTNVSSTTEAELSQQLAQLPKLKSVKKHHDIRKNFRNYKYLQEMVLYAWDHNKFSTSYPQIKKLVGCLGDLRDLYLEERLVQRLKCQDPECQEEGALLSALLNTKYRLQLDQFRKHLKKSNRIDFGVETQPISHSVTRK